MWKGEAKKHMNEGINDLKSMIRELILKELSEGTAGGLGDVYKRQVADAKKKAADAKMKAAQAAQAEANAEEKS